MEKWLPALLALVGLAGVGLWLSLGPESVIAPRLPQSSPVAAGLENEPFSNQAGVLKSGAGVASQLPGSWPGFRGVQRDGIAQDAPALSAQWPPDGPPRVWQIDAGEGYAGVAIHAGRVYLHDYDQAAQQDAIRCLSLDDGREIWRYTQPLVVKRNHGMSRTVPAVSEAALVALGPKCHVTCLNPVTGELRWQIDLVREFGTTVPPWYAGQCPLIDGGRAILAPCGSDLMVAINLATGAVEWRTPNPAGWKMTHASIVPMSLGDRRTYVYCGSGGVAGVNAADGRELWRTREWKIGIATIASPVPVGADRLFFSGGYDAGCMMAQITAEGDGFAVKTVFRRKAEQFGATQQTPILFENHLYGVRPDGELVCLDLEGQVRWSSGPAQRFGLGSYLIADRKLFVVDDHCRLTVCDAVSEKFNLRAQAQIVAGQDAWGPMAIAGGRLVVRDLTKVVCLDVAAP